MFHRRSSWLLAAVLPSVACSDTGTTATGSGSSGDTSASATDDTDPTTSVATTSTASDSDADSTSTTTPDDTTTDDPSLATDDTSSTGADTSDTSDGTSSTDTSGTTGSECGPGQPGPDADGDTVPDACDVCPDGDDLVDGDGDSVADACDACPLDVADDSDGDGVCDSADLCASGPDDIDVDDDGTPDACDDEVGLAIEVPIHDYDVAGDGALAIVRADAGSLLVTCYNGDFSLRREEFVAGMYDAAQSAYPEIQVARDSQRVLLTWYDGGGDAANHRIAYSLFDDACQPLVSNVTAIAQANAYFEFHASAIDEAGNSVITVSPDETLVAFVDADGSATAQEEAFDIGAVYGTHVAVNQVTGEGIVAAQQHSGNGIYYRRFTPGGAAWLDAGAVQMPVSYHYWYDGFTVGMNDESEFVFLWRPDGTVLDMRFFAADATVVADVSRVTIDFEGWDGGHCYDSFRRRHQEIPVVGDDFVLGEVYNWITPQDNRTVQHFRYTALGELVSEDETDVSLDEGLTIRADQQGRTFLRGPSGIVVRGDYP